MPWQRGHCPGSAASPGFFQNEFLFISLEQNREFQPGQRELCCLLLPTLPLVLLLGNFLMLNETKVRFSPQTSGSFISRAEDVVQIHSGSSRWLLSPGDAENPQQRGKNPANPICPLPKVLCGDNDNNCSDIELAARCWGWAGFHLHHWRSFAHLILAPGSTHGTVWK